MMVLLAIVQLALALWQPKFALGLIAAVLPIYLVRFTFFGIPTTLLELGLYATALGVLFQPLVQRGLRDYLKSGWQAFEPYRWPVIALLVSVLLSSVVSSNVRAGLGAWKAWFFDAALYGFLIVLHRKHAHDWVIAGLTIGTTATSMYGVWEFFARHASLDDGRLNSVFGTPNYHALLAVPVIVLLAGVWLQQRRQTVWYTIALAVNLFALYLTKSYGGFFGLGTGLLALGLFQTGRIRKLVLGFLAVSFLLGVVSQIGSDKFRRLSDITSRSSVHVRVEIWQASAYVIRHHSIVGVGPNEYEAAYRAAVPYTIYPPLEWLVAQPHNLLLALLSQTGLLGTAAFVWLLVGFFRTAKRSPYAAALTAAMVALLVHGLVDTPYFKNDLALLFFALITSSLVFIEHSTT